VSIGDFARSRYSGVTFGSGFLVLAGDAPITGDDFGTAAFAGDDADDVGAAAGEVLDVAGVVAGAAAGGVMPSG
jgi:hypothetical protein